MLKRRLFSIVFSIIFTLILGACNDDAENDNPNISSMSTDSSSEVYPHTKAIRIADAKYKFVVTTQQGNQQIIRYQKNQQATPQQKVQQAPKQQTPAPAQPKQQTQAPAQQAQTAGISQTEQRVIDLTNAERRKHGLPELKADVQLSNVAREKSKDMQAKGYFSHTSPTYGSPFDMMRDFGISYKSAAENIAQGQRTPEEVVQAWMNSEGHRKNILNADYTHIGVGHETKSNHWTQMFIRK
jgi:uncharacterized YkwD family protein